MPEYIDREAAIKRLKQLHFGRKDFHLCGGVLLELNAIEAIPAADVKPVVRGKWEYNPGGNVPYCSNCMMPQEYETNYCHECGAEMRNSLGEEMRGAS